MIAEVGSTRNLFIVWILGGLLSLFGALTYAELAAAMPEAGGEYVFLSEAYGPFWGYLYSWTQLAVAKSGSIATLGSGFYLYLSVFFPSLGNSVFILHYPIGPAGGPLEIHYGQLVAIGDHCDPVRYQLCRCRSRRSFSGLYYRIENGFDRRSDCDRAFGRAGQFPSFPRIGRDQPWVCRFLRRSGGRSLGL